MRGHGGDGVVPALGKDHELGVAVRVVIHQAVRHIHLVAGVDLQGVDVVAQVVDIEALVTAVAVLVNVHFPGQAHVIHEVQVAGVGVGAGTGGSPVRQVDDVGLVGGTAELVGRIHHVQGVGVVVIDGGHHDHGTAAGIFGGGGHHVSGCGHIQLIAIRLGGDEVGGVGDVQAGDGIILAYWTAKAFARTRGINPTALRTMSNGSFTTSPNGRGTAMVLFC